MDKELVKRTHIKIGLLMVIGYILIGIIYYYLKFEPLLLVAYISIYGAILILIDMLYLNIGDNNDKIFYSLLILLSLYITLGAREIVSEFTLILITLAILSPMMPMFPVTFLKEKVVSKEAINNRFKFYIYLLIPFILVLGFLSILLELLTGLWIISLLITIISLYLIIRNIKKLRKIYKS